MSRHSRLSAIPLLAAALPLATGGLGAQRPAAPGAAVTVERRASIYP